MRPLDHHALVVTLRRGRLGSSTELQRTRHGPRPADAPRTTTFRAPLDDVCLEHRERVHVSDGDTTEVYPHAANRWRQSATDHDCPRSKTRSESAAHVRGCGGWMRFDGQLRLEHHVTPRVVGRNVPTPRSRRSARAGHADVTVAGSGSSAQIVVPRPTVLSARTRPPCPSTRCLTMARPRPVPPSDRERPASTR